MSEKDPCIAPGKDRNLINDPAHAAKRKELQAHLAQLL